MFQEFVAQISKAIQKLCVVKKHNLFRRNKSATTECSSHPVPTSTEPKSRATKTTASQLKTTDVASIPAAGTPVTKAARTNAVHILDPMHNFTATTASKMIQERRKSEMVLSLFVLARRAGAALVKNVHRDIETLGRLSGISIVSPKHEGMKWWRKQIGAAYESIPKEVWNAALAMATEDLQARGFVVHKFELFAGPELLKIQWKLAISEHTV